MAAYSTWEKIVLVTRPTRLDDLVQRFNTRNQARFYIEHAGGDWSDYQSEHDAYARARDTITALLEGTGLRHQAVDRSLLSTFLFTERDVVVTLGGNGLVVNTVKYCGAQPVVAVNPDTTRFESILVPFTVGEAQPAIGQVLTGRAAERRVTLAEARTEDNQRLLALNDFFVGARTHVSARYRITSGSRSEVQSSSGVLISTGVGSSGWMSSVFNMAAGLARQFGGHVQAPPDLAWDDRDLCFVVREPFVNKVAHADIVAGRISDDRSLTIESLMPGVGTIFSDGVEDDFIAFNSGTRVHIRAAQQQARLVWSS